MSTQIGVLIVPMISMRFSLAEVTFLSSKYNSEFESNGPKFISRDFRPQENKLYLQNYFLDSFFGFL